LVFISETTRAHFPLADGAPAATIFNGVDDAVFRPAADSAERAADRAALGLPADARVLLFVGRFVEKKGLHLLRRLAEAHPDTLFAFAGWGPVDPAGWGLANTRLFRELSGPSLARLYRAVDLFILPSTGEGFPLVIQEALASSLPVVCGAEAAAADPAATPLLAGVALDPADEVATVAALWAAVEANLAGPHDAGARREFARHHYSWTSAAERYRALINQMMMRGHGS
jgi:glycosyltransferase involved in cell wall biosynthesis